MGLAAGVRGAFGRLACGCTLALLLTGLVATQSRSGFIGAATAMLAAVLLMPSGRGRVLRVVVLLVCVIGALLLTNPGAAKRLFNAEDQGNGRVGLAAVAWRMVEDHPATGVGLANFPVHSPDYVRDAGSLEFVDLIAERGLPVHNTYLQLLAETGPVGLALFLALCAACLRAAWRAAWTFERVGRPELAVLAWAVLVGGIGTLTVSAFLSNGSDVQLWLLLAAGPALAQIARRDVTAAQRAPSARRAAGAPARRPVRAARG